jgi:hypothetical protein
MGLARPNLSAVIGSDLIGLRRRIVVYWPQRPVSGLGGLEQGGDDPGAICFAIDFFGISLDRDGA